MNELYFINVIQIGNLYLEKVLNKFEDENIIFICKDLNGNRYLCICYEFRLSLKWIICKITPETLIKLIANRIDINTVFELEQNHWIQILYKNGNEISRIFTCDNSVENILPKRGVFLKTDQEISKYLRFICFNFTKTSSYTCERFIKYPSQRLTTGLNTTNNCSCSNSNYIISYDLNNARNKNEKDLSFINLFDAA